VGPVHAGIIEPGQFRFSVVGEKVLRLEERLGYAHKGIEKRFEQIDALSAVALAARISGDSAVAYSWAYCMALEGACGVEPPPRALVLRGIALERERIANHLGDLGALGNDAGFGLGLAQFLRLKEDLLRLNVQIHPQRYWMDAVLPGGVAYDLRAEHVDALATQHQALRRDVYRLREIYDDHSGIQDRFAGCGQLSRDLALQLDVQGMVARASGLPFDLRRDRAWAPYAAGCVPANTQIAGDVAARVGLRFDEIDSSIALCERWLEALPEGSVGGELPAASEGHLGVGLVEGWRGPVLIVLETGPNQSLRRCHPHDPSWQNWPALEHAIIGNIVPDFPLINKSFNLSYSGVDL
jgi:Ni,Fe-hydrogenase III large subunit